MDNEQEKDILLKVIEIVFSNEYPEYKEDELIELLKPYVKLLKVIEIVFSNEYPEYKEDELIELLKPYVKESD